MGDCGRSVEKETATGRVHMFQFACCVTSLNGALACTHGGISPRRTAMHNVQITCSIVLLFWVGGAASQSQSSIDVQQIADTMVRLCVGGGTTQAVSGTATGGADFSLRSLDVK